MDPFTIKIFIKVDGLSIIRKLCNIVWFSKIRRRFVYCVNLPLNLLVAILLIPTFFELKHDLKLMSKQSAILATTLQFQFKLFVFFLEYDRIIRMKKTIDENFWDINNSGIKLGKKMARYFSLIRFLFVCHISAAVVGTMVVMAFPFVPYPPDRRILPLLVWIPLPSRVLNTSPVHEILYVLISYVSIISIITIILYDFWFVYCIQHLYVQIELIKEKYSTMVNFRRLDDIFIVHSVKYQNIIEKRMKYCIDHHVVLIQFGKDLREMLSIVNTFQSGVTLITLVFLGFAIAKDHSNMIDVYQIASYITSIIIQISIFTFNGTELQYQSTTITTAILQSKWYLCKGPLRKDLVFVIKNAQKTIALTAGGFFEINNETLIKIFRLTFSFITLLLSEAENDEEKQLEEDLPPFKN